MCAGSLQDVMQHCRVSLWGELSQVVDAKPSLHRRNLIDDFEEAFFSKQLVFFFSKSSPTALYSCFDTLEFPFSGVRIHPVKKAYAAG
jgi:hypothetical protein